MKKLPVLFKREDQRLYAYVGAFKYKSSILANRYKHPVIRLTAITSSGPLKYSIVMIANNSVL